MLQGVKSSEKTVQGGKIGENNDTCTGCVKSGKTLLEPKKWNRG